jgi:chemotaxis protein MotB
MSDHPDSPKSNASHRPHPLGAAPHSGGGSHDEGGEGWLVSYADMMTLLVGFFVILMSFSKIDDEKLEELKESATKEFGGSYRAPHEELAEKMTDALKKLGLGDEFILKRTATGLSISFYGTVFFAQGSADLRAEGNAIIEKVVHVIDAEAKGYRVQIEGHTDDVPLSSGGTFRNNWELSAIRSSRVLALFEKEGFSQKDLTAIGYGEARPMAKNRDESGEPIVENQAKNRRVVIQILKPTETTMGLGETESAPPPK